MPQLHLSVDEDTARRLAEAAKAEGKTLSRYITTLVRRHFPQEWPEGYHDRVVGSCAGQGLREPDELSLDEVDLRPGNER